MLYTHLNAIMPEVVVRKIMGCLKSNEAPSKVCRISEVEYSNYNYDATISKLTAKGL